MNVFVLCTGRSGSVTFATACHYFTNYTVGHETRSRIIGPDERFNFPDNHIEVDNHFSLQLGHLERRFGAEAFYVHLTRDPQKVAQSFTRLFDASVSAVANYASGVLMQNKLISDEERMAAAQDYVATVAANIAAFLADKPRQITVDIEHPDTAFREFSKRIGAQGNIDQAIDTLHQPMNLKLERRSHSLLKRKILAAVRLLPF